MNKFKEWEEAFEKLPKETQQKFLDRVSETLDGFLWCSRTWGAWSYGTMSQDDFTDAADDDVVWEHAVKTYGLFLELNNTKD